MPCVFSPTLFFTYRLTVNRYQNLDIQSVQGQPILSI
ncbi:hypothetical protein BGS_1150 [Beggiatoa sp. SS]|nr:hypothetical protein BGS_1150 [Beggiatoa sp. SS]